MSSKKKSLDWVEYKPGNYDPFFQNNGYYLDEKAGQKVINFFSDCLTHVRGPMKGQPFKLELWLAAIIGHIYGWKSKKTGLRRYRELLLLVPRKNAKSLLGAGIGIVEIFLGDPNTPEIMVASGDREQARQMHDTMKLMIQGEEELRSRLDVFKNIIQCDGNDGFLKVVSSESYNLHGANLSLALVDETHVVKRDLVETLQTSQGSRSEPLFVNLSTAGYDKNSVLYEKYDYALKVRDGIINDPAFMPIIYEAGPEDDWTSPEVWKKANPNLGKSINLDFLERECERAKESPAFEATFKRLYLNIWTDAESPWLQMARYDECVSELPDLTGRACYAGLDLASTTDLAALVLCVMPVGDEPFYILPFVWCPGDSIRDRSKRDKVPYLQWKNQNHIEMTPGAVIDYGYILNRIDEVAQKYDLRGIVYDRWGSTKIIQEIQDQGLEVIQFGQGFKDMSPPTKELMKLILEKQVMFPSNPVMRWNFSNLVVEQDAAGNLKPSKKRSIEKIDIAVAAIMALDGAVRNTMQQKAPSVLWM
jgi:phage terminase large subunit-like protein